MTVPSPTCARGCGDSGDRSHRGRGSRGSAGNVCGRPDVLVLPPYIYHSCLPVRASPRFPAIPLVVSGRAVQTLTSAEALAYPRL
jgi:hypothetical protein